MEHTKKKKRANKLLPTNDINQSGNVVHYFNKYVTLIENTYGMLFDTQNNAILVKRFTWTNHNKISVSVITYGARIVSVKVPDRGGNIEELVLGFDDLAGYLFYEKYGFGATMGRTTTKLYKGTYVVDGKQYWLEPNEGEHHTRGGHNGFDKVNWVPYVVGNVLQLSYVSKDGDEGYPGDLQVRMTFELTTGAEFKMSITANTTKVTPVDICNITYFNLAGHDAGEEELRKHEFLINANCHTAMDENNEFPTGRIRNVVHTKFNFQVPKLLGEAMGPGPEADYDQNFCVNRGVCQDDAFVARMIHPYKGRVLEIYSNQCGVNFSNGNDFPDGYNNIPAELLALKPSLTNREIEEHEAMFIVISKLAQYFREEMQLQPEEYHGFIRNLMNKLLAADHNRSMYDNDSEGSFTSQLELIDAGTYPGYAGHASYPDFDFKMILKPLEIQFLLAIKELLPYVTEDISFQTLKAAIDDILKGQQEANNDADSLRTNSYFNKIINNPLFHNDRKYSRREDEEEEEGEEEQEFVEDEKEEKSEFRRLKSAKEERERKQMRCGVKIPTCYKKGKISFVSDEP